MANNELPGIDQYYKKNCIPGMSEYSTTDESEDISNDNVECDNQNENKKDGLNSQLSKVNELKFCESVHFSENSDIEEECEKIYNLVANLANNNVEGDEVNGVKSVGSDNVGVLKKICMENHEILSDSTENERGLEFGDKTCSEQMIANLTSKTVSSDNELKEDNCVVADAVSVGSENTEPENVVDEIQQTTDSSSGESTKIPEETKPNENGESSFKSAEEELGFTVGKDTAFYCAHCPVRATSLDNILSHAEVHKRTSQYKCGFCSANFLNARAKNTHEGRIHNLFKTPEIDRRKSGRLKNHESRSSVGLTNECIEVITQCFWCKKDFENDHLLLVHQTSCAKNKTLPRLAQCRPKRSVISNNLVTDLSGTEENNSSIVCDTTTPSKRIRKSTMLCDSPSTNANNETCQPENNTHEVPLPTLNLESDNFLNPQKFKNKTQEYSVTRKRVKPMKQELSICVKKVDMCCDTKPSNIKTKIIDFESDEVSVPDNSADDCAPSEENSFSVDQENNSMDTCETESVNDASDVDMSEPKEQQSPTVSSELGFVQNGLSYDCFECPWQSKNLKRMLMHVEIHRRKFPVKCYHCTATFKNIGGRKKHEVIHTDEIARESLIAEEEFIGESALAASQSASESAVVEKRETQNGHDSLRLKKQESETCSSVPSKTPTALRKIPKITEPTDDLEALILNMIILMLGESALHELGWPDKSVCDLLASVLEHCNVEPAITESISCITHEYLEENCKVLFEAAMGMDKMNVILNTMSVVDALNIMVTTANAKEGN